MLNSYIHCIHRVYYVRATILGLSFQIAEGGFLDIDVRIIGPDAKVVYEDERQTSGKYSFAAHFPGIYTFCFSNKMSTMTPKVVMFDVAVGEPPKQDAQEEGQSANKLEEMIRELSGKLLWFVLLETTFITAHFNKQGLISSLAIIIELKLLLALKMFDID